MEYPVFELVCDNKSGNLNLELAMAKLLVKLFDLFKKKQASYGCENILLFGLHGILIRMSDKFQRLKNLVWQKKPNPLENETIEDTYLDLADYALISVLVMNGDWHE